MLKGSNLPVVATWVPPGASVYRSCTQLLHRMGCGGGTDRILDISGLCTLSLVLHIHVLLFLTVSGLIRAFPYYGFIVGWGELQGIRPQTPSVGNLGCLKVWSGHSEDQF